MRNKSVIWLILGGAFIICFCFGCSREAREKKVVARINNYVMTVEDLEDEIKYSSYAAEETQDLQDLLDLAIRREILIQEAQRQDLDKQKSFMKTIERYWRQTLIKELLEEETKRIYQGVSKDKQDQAMDDWMEGLYKKANIKIYKNVLEEVDSRK